LGEQRRIIQTLQDELGEQRRTIQSTQGELAVQKEAYDQKILDLRGEMRDPRVNKNLPTVIENPGSLQHEEKDGQFPPGRKRPKHL
jgi:hypothetical protein